MSAEFYSEWGLTTNSRRESEVSEFLPSRRISEEVLLSPVVHCSEEGVNPDTNVRVPGGFLTWVARKPGGESHVHACRVHQTVESSIIEADDPTNQSKIDTYIPPAGMRSSDGHFPFAPATAVYIDRGRNPKVLCLSNGVTMFAADNFRVEEKNLELDLYDRPTRVAAGEFRGQKVIGACMKMLNGDVAFMIANETAELSSSSSSSLSSLSSSSMSSSSSTQIRTSSSCSSPTSESSISSQSSSSSSVGRTSSSSSSQSHTSQSSASSSSRSSASSSLSSESWNCEWDLVQVVDENFRDMDWHQGGKGTVWSEFSSWNISGLNPSNTDACSLLWCVYVPRGTYGVGGSAIGQVYMYRTSGRPYGPPYSNSVMVGGFALDGSGGFPKTITITDRGTGSGIGGTVVWAGGYGYTTLLPGCSAYRLQIPFKLCKEESSVSSESSYSTLSSRSSSSQSSSVSMCPSGYRYCSVFYAESGSRPNTWFSTPPLGIEGGNGNICEFYIPIRDTDFIMTGQPQCEILTEVRMYKFMRESVWYWYLSVVMSKCSASVLFAVGQLTNILFTEGWVDLIGSGQWYGHGIVGRIYLKRGSGGFDANGSAGYVKLHNRDPFSIYD